ncbi:uncharacterized protein DSM5745_05896 [Aspergillus mulundensis]|uniref:Uncharacterized protein n=1 Tax=Aspergillus mulundensis TaxID=1810919 RepID=A0A3D8RYV8_9EURO|nr:hypothetical protein DSM5745_05896 [Aspergillus mulundensis]RDW79044.1 hypothetical protein DSM5745_05896 [Aspergillus mulundensis]
MSNQPWLESLSDDWVSLPGTPTSPGPPRSPINNHSRRSSLQTTPSRIPIPARRSVEPSPLSDSKKKVPRPCHHIRRELPTPKTPRTPKTPSKPRSPYPNIVNTKPNPPPGPYKQSVMDGRSPLRSVSNASSQPEQEGTVQIKPKKEKGKQGTPEWRKRLVNGDIPAGDQRDLFAPIGLESVFKPPSPGSPLAGSTPIPRMKQPDDRWNFSASSAAEKKGKPPGQVSRSSRGSARTASGKSAKQGSRTVERDGKQTTKSRNEESQLKKPAAHLSPHMAEGQGDSTDTAQMRSASGLEDLRNEDITPITFSRTNTVDGEGTAEIIKSALKQVTTKLEKLQLAPVDRPVSRASDSLLMSQHNDIIVEAAAEDDLFDVTSHSLPQDLSMGTLDYRGRSAFTSLQGDSFADERSSQKDQLSPAGFPSHRLTPFIRPSTRIRSSPPFYNKSNAQNDPLSLPRPSSAHVGTSSNKIGDMPSSGSPLKLFANHDTFTNNKLLRRMSQFEETLGEDSDEDEPVSPSEEAGRKRENRSFLHPGERIGRRHERSRSRNTQTPRINRFGEGQLDNFDFSDASPFDAQFLNTDSPEPDVSPPGYLLASGGRAQKGRSYRQTSGESQAFSSLSFKQNSTDLTGLRATRPRIKTTPSSPVKDPTPKRRRMARQFNGSMLGDATIEDSEGTDDLSLLQRSLMQHGLRYSENEEEGFSESANRPRTPTPHQTGSFERRQPSPDRRREQLEPDGHDYSLSPLAQNMPNAIGRQGNEEVRRGSITTQDFLNEATKVMNFIRSKGTAKSSLSRVDETDTEEHDGNESYEEESTLEEFSRPPSREGGDLRRLREPQEPNPRILNHLKKFQENDELEFGVSGSVTSLHLGGNDSERGDSDKHRKRKLPAPPPTQEDDLYDFLRLNTETSSKNFSARSVQTGSSQGSHAKGVLSSDIVSHLIPEQVNGFTYDRLKHLWVKEDERKSRSSQQYKNSDEDPFKDIPDLSVDEMDEMMRTEKASYPRKEKDSAHAEETEPRGAEIAGTDGKASDPVLEDAAAAPSVNLSSLQSGVSRSSTTNPTSGTRETSWGTEVPKSTTSSHDIEHEIKLHEGRLSKSPHLARKPAHQARVVTISFSSPLVSQIEYSDDDSPSKLRRIAIAAQAQAAAAENSALQSFNHEQEFPRRSISKIDEQNEDTAEGHSLIRRATQELEPVSPERNVDASLAYVQEHGLDTSYSFHLSPLPDFTVNQIDQPSQLDISYVAQRTHPTSLRQIHGTFALATEDLIKHITEAEPCEPYWEHLRRLVMRRKGLMTLHKLSDFCPRLEELDVSENDIGQLSGVPSTVRNLRIQNNCLSNLTAWGHLGNLQYLDISGNELENLDAVSGLIHLRELIADNNNIRHIEGIFGLNGLLTLKLRNNRLDSIDFNTAELTRLSELDLSHNGLTSIRNIHNLSTLSQLDLSSNRLESAPFSSPLTMLRALKLSDNRLRSLDVGLFPALILLYVDQNCLSTLSGLDNTRDLEVLSAREQEIPGKEFFDLDLGMVKDIRKVYLSSNKLSPQALSPSAPLLSLQLLDIATCRLKELPIDFAAKFPNIKVLNLNFNSLEGVNELLGMNCLSRLTVAGNSISRLRRICQVLSRIGRTRKSNTCTLQKVDIRHNPLTVRFYPPAITGNGKQHTQKLISNEKARSRNSQGLDLDMPLMAQLDRDGQLLPIEDEDDEGGTHPDPEINDPYTLPPADLLLDQKHLAHLDQATRLKRRVFELMLYAGTGGAIKYLDGLEFRPALEPGSDMNQAWARLEQLGVLKKKAITG